MESKTGIDVFTIIVLGSLAMLTMVSFIIVFIVLYQKRMLAHKTTLQENENKYQRQLLDASIEVAEQERKKIATNIHDDVGLVLNVIKLNFTKINRNLSDTKLVEELLQSNSGLLEDTINSLRAISHDLMPPTLVKLGFLRGVNEMCRQINASGDIEVDLTSNQPEVNLSKKNELQLYRLIKEILNNVVKHASASKVNIDISGNSSNLSTVIKHNGTGISTKMVYELANSGKGIGLKSILSRAQLTDSNIEYIVVNDKESKIIIDTPLYGGSKN